MILCDVGVLLQAMVSRSAHHAACRRAVEAACRGPDPLAISEVVLAAVVRIATNPRVFRPAIEPAVAFGFTDALARQPGAVRIVPGARHWDIFRDLVLSTGIRGADVTDAYLAALAIEHGCEWWTTDDGFRRFRSLRWRSVTNP